jgi:hypothetical protein
MSRTLSAAMLRRLGIVAALAGALVGCQDTLSRRETLTWSSGDAVAWNKAVHTIDPWPAASRNTDIPVSGRRVAIAIERYETRGAPTDAGPGMPVAPMVVVPNGPVQP